VSRSWQHWLLCRGAGNTDYYVAELAGKTDYYVAELATLIIMSRRWQHWLLFSLYWTMPYIFCPQMYTPEDQKDGRYWEKRAKNNAAARRWYIGLKGQCHEILNPGVYFINRLPLGSRLTFFSVLSYSLGLNIFCRSKHSLGRKHIFLNKKLWFSVIYDTKGFTRFVMFPSPICNSVAVFYCVQK
jgi:hypothetical protein